MPEIRIDPLTGLPTILVPDRADRPEQPDPCPFCPGNEHLTPPEIARVGLEWQVRVVPNRYPLVEGAHEVVVLSRDHRASIGQLPVPHVLEVLRTLRDRSRHHTAAGRPCTQLFVNHGHAGGASLPHPHAQLVALDRIPPTLRQEADQCPPDRCPLCSALPHLDELTVVDDGAAVAWCPWASTTAFELMIAPSRHDPQFEDSTDTDLLWVADALVEALARLRRSTDDAPYNLALHSGPPDEPGFHWHIHVWPRLQTPAGFERSTGIAVTTVDPAHAAAALRATGLATAVDDGRVVPGGVSRSADQ